MSQFHNKSILSAITQISIYISIATKILLLINITRWTFQATRHNFTANHVFIEDHCKSTAKPKASR